MKPIKARTGMDESPSRMAWSHVRVAVLGTLPATLVDAGHLLEVRAQRQGLHSSRWLARW
jgi:hypothetical protein